MSATPTRPFGRRGQVAQKLPHPAAPARDATATALPADVVAAILRPGAGESDVPSRPRAIKVPRSLRAALLAGLCIGFFSAALNVTAFAGLDRQTTLFLGESSLPLPVIALTLGLWSGARTTAFSLLVTHRILNLLGWTRPAAYALGGGAIALAWAAGVHGLTPQLPHQPFAVECLAGCGAGFLYRLFAGTISADQS